MALRKERVSKKGIQTSYHRLAKVTAEANGHVEMTVLSYASELYRVKEKRLKENNKRYEELMQFIQDENSKAEEERDTEKVIEWSNAINEMEFQWRDETDEANQTFIESNVYTFDNVDIKKTYNYSDAYDMLKTLEDFADAEDLYEEDQKGVKPCQLH